MFHYYSSAARSGPSLRTKRAGGDSPALHALSLYEVLERSDWQQLPQFQALDAMSQALIEQDATELLLIRAIELLEGPRVSKDVSAKAQSVAELLSRVPASQRDRYTVAEFKRAAGGTATGSQVVSPPPEGEWESFDLYLAGVVAAARGEFARAIRFFDSVLNRPPDNDIDALHYRFWTHFNRAYCAEQTGDTDSAIADYGACIGLDNRVAGPHHNLGLIYARQERFDLAAKYLRESVRRAGDRTVSCYANLAAAELKLGNLSAALDAADDAISLDDRCAEAYANRGAVRAAMGHRETALADLQRALELDPDCAAARQNLILLNQP
jgi:tetratricopeptide (TPR) repeat protein